MEPINFLTEGFQALSERFMVDFFEQHGLFGSIHLWFRLRGHQIDSGLLELISFFLSYVLYYVKNVVVLFLDVFEKPIIILEDGEPIFWEGLLGEVVVFCLVLLLG